MDRVPDVSLDAGYVIGLSTKRALTSSPFPTAAGNTKSEERRTQPAISAHNTTLRKCKAREQACRTSVVSPSTLLFSYRGDQGMLPRAAVPFARHVCHLLLLRWLPRQQRGNRCCLASKAYREISATLSCRCKETPASEVNYGGRSRGKSSPNLGQIDAYPYAHAGTPKKLKYFSDVLSSTPFGIFPPYLRVAAIVRSMRTSAFLLATVCILFGVTGRTAAGPGGRARARINMRRAFGETFVSIGAGERRRERENPAVDLL